MATLERLCNKHVMPGFTDRSAEEREIERQTADITRVRVPFVFPFWIISLLLMMI